MYVSSIIRSDLKLHFVMRTSYIRMFWAQYRARVIGWGEDWGHVIVRET